MKLTFTATSKAQAEKFQTSLKTERGLESTFVEKDGKFFVEYSLAEIAFAAKKKQKKEKKSECKCEDKEMVSKASNEIGKCCEEVEEDEGVSEDDVEEMMGELASYIFREMQYQTNWLASEIAYINNAFYKHTSEGHLPPINGADKLQKALEILGVAGDYEIRKQIVYASAKNGGLQVDVDLTK